MKHIAGLIAMNAAIAALLSPSAALATNPGAGGIGTVSAGTAVTGSFNVGNHGTSTSYAQNKESAMASITANKSYTTSYAPNCERNVSANASILGSTKTQSAGTAYNISTGSGSGNALSAGNAGTATGGSIGIHGVTSGFNGGKSGTRTDNVIKAGNNQGSYISGETVSGFDAKVSYNKGYESTGASRTGTVAATGSNSGYASGANASGALENMNAAGLANIGASGYFFGKTNLSGSTGHVTAP